MGQKCDDEGIIKLAAAIFEQAKSDYIIGKIVMIRKIRKVVDQKEFTNLYRKRLGKETVNRIDLYFDAKNFIEKDPYGVVESFGSANTIFKTWDNKVKEAVDGAFSVTKSTYASRLKGGIN